MIYLKFFNLLDDYSEYLIKSCEETRQIEESVRFYNCQFIISTHSPFLLNLYEAKIYNLDLNPVEVKKWTELETVKLYYDFLKKMKLILKKISRCIYEESMYFRFDWFDWV